MAAMKNDKRTDMALRMLIFTQFMFKIIVYGSTYNTNSIYNMKLTKVSG